MGMTNRIENNYADDADLIKSIAKPRIDVLIGIKFLAEWIFKAYSAKMTNREQGKVLYNMLSILSRGN